MILEIILDEIDRQILERTRRGWQNDTILLGPFEFAVVIANKGLSYGGIPICRSKRFNRIEVIDDIPF